MTQKNVYAVYTGYIHTHMEKTEYMRGLNAEKLMSLCENDSIDIENTFFSKDSAMRLFNQYKEQTYTDYDENDGILTGAVCWMSVGYIDNDTECFIDTGKIIAVGGDKIWQSIGFYGTENGQLIHWI